MRKSCIECVRKHLGDAVVLLDEVFMGYPEHSILAEGNLSQAASEAVREFPQLAIKLRDIRKDCFKAYSAWRTGSDMDTVKTMMPDVTDILKTVDELCVAEWLNEKHKADVVEVKAKSKAVSSR